MLDDENGDYSSGVKQSARISFADGREKSQSLAECHESFRHGSAASEPAGGVEGSGSGSGQGSDSAVEESDVKVASCSSTSSASTDDKDSVVADHLTAGKFHLEMYRGTIVIS